MGAAIVQCSHRFLKVVPIVGGVGGSLEAQALGQHHPLGGGGVRGGLGGGGRGGGDRRRAWVDHQLFTGVGIGRQLSQDYQVAFLHILLVI